MPDDWSIVQLGTTGSYKEKSFEVIGRVRLQLRQEYKTFWCVWYEQTHRYGWLAESFGEYILCENAFFDKDNFLNQSRFRAGDKFVLHNKTKVVTDYIDICEWVSLEGELCHWPNLVTGFMSIQAQNNQGIASYLHIQKSNSPMGTFMVGEVIELQALNLKLIREWDEWK